MKRGSRWQLPRSILFEALLLVLILLGVGHAAWAFHTSGYLPQPFIWDPQDTLMDWFNPAYWAHHEGVYSVWRAVYPPLSFAILKGLSTSSCYVTSSFAGRDCDWFGQISVLVLYGLAMGVTYRTLRAFQPQAALLRTIAIAVGLPGLYVLERGNLLILCQLCLALAVVPGMSGRFSKALAAATMINLKPYLLLPVMAWAVKREWRQLELAGFATVAVFLVSWAIVGSGSPLEIASNTANWVQVTGTDVVGEMFYTTSFNSMFGVLDRGFPVYRFIGSRDYELYRTVIGASVFAAQGAAILALALACLRPQTVAHPRLALLLLLLSLTARSPGGYSEILVVFLIFLESWRGAAAIIAIVTAYLISIPYEWIVSYLPDIHTASWLSGHAVTARFGIGIGQFARPIGLLIILLALSLDSIVQAMRCLVADHKTLSVATRSMFL